MTDLRHPLLALAILIWTVAGAGCLYDPFAGCGKVVSLDWNEPGMYEAFPEPGRVGDYLVRWHENVTHPDGPFNVADDKNLSNDKGVTNKFVLVTHANDTKWSVNRPTPLSDEDTLALFEETLDELGLPRPEEQPPDEIDWGTAAC